MFKDQYKPPMEPTIDLMNHLEIVEELPRWPFGNLKGVPLSSELVTTEKLAWLAGLIHGNPDRVQLAMDIRNERIRRQIIRDRTPEPPPATQAERIAKLQRESGVVIDVNPNVKVVHESAKFVASGKRRAIVPELGEAGMPQAKRKEGRHYLRH